MTKLDRDAIHKREYWASRSGVDTYIQEMGAYAVARDAEIVGRLLGSGPGKLLDIPCGTGRFITLCCEHGYTVTAADYSPTMMGVAQSRHDVEFVRADVFDPPFASDSFDVILIMRLLFHYAEPENALRALVRTLRPGGRMIFDTLNPGSSRWLAAQVLNGLRGSSRRVHFEPRERMRQKLAELSLEVVEEVPAYFLPTRFYRALPSSVSRVVDRFENSLARVPRVLTYWHVRSK